MTSYSASARLSVAPARDDGMPNATERGAGFEGRGARLVHDLLPMTAHEASHEEVWSYVTCCWLFDVAIWRFGATAPENRFLGDLNRNTFRRMWWRAEVLGPDIDLARLGEDELVAIMERPTIASDSAIGEDSRARVPRAGWWRRRAREDEADARSDQAAPPADSIRRLSSTGGRRDAASDLGHIRCGCCWARRQHRRGTTTRRRRGSHTSFARGHGHPDNDDHRPKRRDLT